MLSDRKLAILASFVCVHAVGGQSDFSFVFWRVLV